MKTSLFQVGLLSCLLLGQLPTNVARAGDGNSSGAGTVDHVFLLAEVIAAKMQLTPQQMYKTLKLTFDSSSGKVPELFLQRDDAQYKEFGFFQAGKESRSLSLNVSHQEITSYAGASIHASKKLIPGLNKGPLLGGQNLNRWSELSMAMLSRPNGMHTVQPSLQFGAVSTEYITSEISPTITQTGLELSYANRRYEFRKYAPNIVVYTSAATTLKNGKPDCWDPSFDYVKNQAGKFAFHNSSNSDGLCEIGYFWVSSGATVQATRVQLNSDPASPETRIGDYDFLLRAFRESQGRVPQFYTAPMQGNPDVSCGSFFPFPSFPRGKILYDWSLEYMTYTLFPSGWVSGVKSLAAENDFRFHFSQYKWTSTDQGPLLGGAQTGLSPWRVKAKATNLYGAGNEQFYHDDVDNLRADTTGLIGQGTYHNLEFRQYDRNTVIYVITPIAVGKNKGQCIGWPSELSNNIPPITTPNKDGICAIGYIWNELANK